MGGPEGPLTKQPLPVLLIAIVDDTLASREVAGTRPARPEDEREQGADDADDEQDVADGVDVEAYLPARGGHCETTRLAGSVLDT